MAWTRILLVTFAGIGSAWGLGGCFVHARTQPAYGTTYVAPAQGGTTYVAPAQGGTTYVAPAQTTVATCGGCVQGMQEVCNGCDDNCNGVIDEDCTH